MRARVQWLGDAQAQTTPGGSDLDQYHFAQLDSDSESNTDHAQFRQYSSTEGRWMSPDPYAGSYDMSNPQSMNRYAYVMNSPLSYLDPMGLDCYQVGGDTWGTAIEGPNGPITENGNDPGQTVCDDDGGYGSQIGYNPIAGVGGAGGGGTGGFMSLSFIINPPPQCTALQTAAAQLANVLSSTSTDTGWIAIGTGFGTAVSGAGEGFTFGIDTPVTVTFGAASAFFGTVNLVTGAAAGALNAFASSGNMSGLQDFAWGNLVNVATTAAASRIPGVGHWAETVGNLAEQGYDLATRAQQACQ